MLFLVGIPKAFYQEVLQAVTRSSPGELVSGLPFEGSGQPDQMYLDDCLDTLVAFHKGRPGCFEKGLAVVALQYHGGGDFSKAADFFCPFALFKSVTYEGRLTHTGSRRLRDKNNLVRLLSSEAKSCLKLRNTVTSYLRSRSNRTPLLLPIRHFGEPQLKELVDRAWYRLRESNDAIALFDQLAGNFETTFPFNKKRGAAGFFANSRNVEFRSPGRDLHGVLRSHTHEHAHSCFLNAFLRVGGQIKTGFHYDCCQKDGKAHGGSFPNCHDERVERQGKPHLNVFPNDFIR